jgi:hypothetical protein
MQDEQGRPFIVVREYVQLLYASAERRVANKDTVKARRLDYTATTP